MVARPVKVVQRIPPLGAPARTQQLGDAQQDELVAVLHVRLAASGVSRLLSSATTMCWPSTTSTSSMVTKGDAVLAAARGHAVGVLDVERVDVPDFLTNPSRIRTRHGGEQESRP